MYMCKDILNLGDNEVYLDGGAFNGDSVFSFINLVGNSFKKIYAFEPSTKPFLEIVSKFQNDQRIVAKNFGLFSSDTKLSFEQEEGTRSSSLGGVGLGLVNCVALDNNSDFFDLTFIKLNIEGAEFEAIKGMRDIIRQKKPKLAIAVYHKMSHIWEIPLIIHEINPSYKFFIRQHDGGIIETVLYAI